MTETPAALPTPEATTPGAPAGRAWGFWRKRPADRPRWVRFEQAVYGSFAFRDDGYTVLAQSPRCRPEWVAGFRTACQKIGERPAGVAEFPGLFALPLDGGVWAVVGMSPQGLDDRGRPGALAFHGLFLSRRDYRKTGCDPFRLAAALRSDWDATTESLPSGLLRLEPPSPQPSEPSPDDPRTARIAAALARGRRVAFEASGPAEDLARQVWRTLPERTRRRTSVATWAFGNANQFGLVALPRLAGVTLDESYADPAAFSLEGSVCPDGGPTSWPEQAARRVPRLPVEPQTLALVSGGILLAGAAVALALRGPDDDLPAAPPATVQTPAEAADRPAASPRVERPKRGAPAPGLPDPADFPAAAEDDDPAERRRVVEVLEDLADRCGLPRPAVAGTDPLPLMERIATRLRYRGPWLDEADRANLADAESPRARALAIAWHDAVRRFAPDRPLPDDFRSGTLRWQLAVLSWSFHLEPPADRLGEGPRRTVSELAQGFAGSLAREVAVGPDPLTERYGALAGYAAFLARLPRR